VIRATWFGIAGNALLAVVKITVGVFANSWAVIGDGIDSASDVLSYIVALVAAKIMLRPPDHKFPYGYNRADAIATKILGFFIFFVGAQIVFSSIIALFENAPIDPPERFAVWVTLLSIAGKIALSLWQLRESKRTGSKMLKANAKNMQGDIFLSISVLVGLVAIEYFGVAQIDRYMAIAVGLWIMKVAFDFWRESSKELMDGGAERKYYQMVFDAAHQIDGVMNPHKLRIRKLSNLLIIDVDIEVDGELSVAEAHEIGVALENKIRNDIENVYDVMIHVEPAGNEEREKFGVSPSSF